MKLRKLKFFMIRLHKKIKKALIVTAFPLGLALGIVLALSISMFTSVSYAGIITDTFPRGDISEGLDFQGNFDYAANTADISGTSGVGIAIDDAYFTSDSVADADATVTVTADGSNDDWQQGTYGQTATNDALENTSDNALAPTSKVSEPSSVTIILLGFFVIGVGRLMREHTKHG